MTPIPAKLPAWIQACLDNGFKPEVCSSAAGYYIGAMHEGLPYARYSRDYYPDFFVAHNHLLDGTWIPKANP